MDVKFNDDRWQNWFMESARGLGLTTIAGDRNHVQAVPGSVIRPILAERGLCPDRRFPYDSCITDSTGFDWDCAYRREVAGGFTSSGFRNPRNISF